MRFICLLPTIILLCLSQLSCKQADSFEAIVEECREAWDTDCGVICPQSLQLRTTSGEIKNPLIVVNTTQRDKFGDLHLRGSKGDKPFDPMWGWIITDQISSGGKQLAAKDLRIGQRIRVTYDLPLKQSSQKARVDVLNYSPSLRVLRLLISIELSGGIESEVSPEAVESVVITNLSWRLPPDIGIVKTTEMPEGLPLLGDLKVRYRLSRYATEWTFRTKQILERIEIDTKPTDANVSTNWTQLEFTGRIGPLGPELRDYQRVGALGKVPSFEYQSASKNSVW